MGLRLTFSAGGNRSGRAASERIDEGVQRHPRATDPDDAIVAHDKRNRLRRDLQYHKMTASKSYDVGNHAKYTIQSLRRCRKGVNVPVSMFGALARFDDLVTAD